jgi:hypothetical protein
LDKSAASGVSVAAGIGDDCDVFRLLHHAALLSDEGSPTRKELILVAGMLAFVARPPLG